LRLGLDSENKGKQGNVLTLSKAPELDTIHGDGRCKWRIDRWDNELIGI